MFAVTLAVVSALPAASTSARIRKVYVGSDGEAHLVDSTGHERTIPKEQNQVGVSAPKVAADGQIAGWLIEEDNCCTSYTIPTSLIIYRGGKKLRVSDGLMIYDWCFVARGSRVALSTGTVHGMTSRHFLLYDSRNGRRLLEWTGTPDKTPPEWAKDLRQ